MNDSGDILSLLGIPREKVAFIDGFHVDEKEDKIVISLIDDRPSCPYCNSKNTWITNKLLFKKLMNFFYLMRLLKPTMTIFKH